MSTKSTIAQVGDSAWLEEETIDGTTWLAITNPKVETRSNGSSLFLLLQFSPILLDTIAEIHSKRGFPHQYAVEESNTTFHND